jgi:C4-dicarboxylate transporter
VGATLIPLMMRSGITLACYLYKDHRAVAAGAAGAEKKPDAITEANVLYALAPFVPLTLLIVGNAWVPALKMGVPQAIARDHTPGREAAVVVAPW